MNRTRHLTATTLALALAGALATLANPAGAATLTPGVFTPLPGTTVGIEPQLAGLILVDDVVPFSFAADGGTISGTVQSRVVRSTLDGTLDFYWRVINSEKSTSAIQDLRLGDFVAPEYEANWRIDGLGDKAPSVGYLFESPPRDPGYINFRFWKDDPKERGAGLQPGEGSNFILLDTSAKVFAKTAAYDLTNFGQSQISASFATYAPAVPEPQTYALMALGLAAMGGYARRRQRRTED